MAELLICDDDALLRRALYRTLTHAGHVCRTASTGEETLSALAELPGRLDVVVADFHMPGMNGARLLAQVQLREPEVMRLLISGAEDFGSACAAVNQGGAFRILSKPFEPAELVEAVAQAVELRRRRCQAAAELRELVLNNARSRRVARYACRLGLELGLSGSAGLKGEAIAVGARIFAVVDAFDAITSDRPYRRGRSFGVARDEIWHCRGTRFDADVVAAFMRVPESEWAALGAALASDEPPR